MRRSPVLRPSRRGFLAGAAAALSLPLPALAVDASRRRFLFLFCKGGWDQTWAFAPVFGSPYVDMPVDGVADEVGGIPFVDADARPQFRAFLERHAHRTAILNGIEVPSVAHDGCTRIVSTGTVVEGHDDWASILAGNASGDPMLPLVHFAGPSYAATYASSVVRVGGRNQLVDLLSPDVLTRSDLPVTPPGASVEALMDARVSALAQARASAAGAGWERRLYEGAAVAEERLARLKTLGFGSSVATSASLQDQVDLALDYLAAGHARVAMVQYAAWDGVFNGWDTHTAIDLQGNHYSELFDVLLAAVDRAEVEPGPDGGTLLDELVVVVFSEMGRYPLLNGDGGKDHWTWTSAMLVGSGVAGGRAVGGYDDRCQGRRLDLASGEATDSGVPLLAANFGATLLALGDVDPGPHVGDAGEIAAVLG
jgi:uncharacterized protein (DUF1501 family)